MRYVKSVVVALICVLMFGYACWYETHYTKDAQVVLIQDDVVTCEDAYGDRWEFYGTDYEIGQVVRLTFFTNHTDTLIYDDEITNVR